MKFLIGLMVIVFSFNSFACPDFQGKYINCRSGDKRIKREYILDQHQEGDYEVYDIESIDSETGENRKDQLKTDNKNASRKETLPKLAVTVRIDLKTRCEGNTVISIGDAFFLDSKVGIFTSKIFREGNLLRSTLDGLYLGKEAHKNIICELQ
jgi:hypothetical protein